MAEPDWKPTADAIRKYYIFLAEDLGAIPPDSIVEPPEAGWPSITRDALAGLEKTDAVIELLRHIPYIEPSEDYNTRIAPSTDAVDYRQVAEYSVAPGTRHKFIDIGSEDYPPNVVVLAEESVDADGYGSLLLFDTETGLAYDYQPKAPRQAHEPDPHENPEESLLMWQYSDAAPIADLLASWEENFRSLEWTANPYDTEGGMLFRADNMTDEARQIYRDHGWPDDFRREECLNALQAWNSTIGDRLAEPGNTLRTINREPPGPHDNDGRTSEDDYNEEDEE